MKINATFTKLMMVAAFGLVLHSCSTDDSEIQSDKAVKTEMEMHSKVKDSVPSESEPVIVRPRG